ncbi:hypothetical protein I6A84_22245 [Frankia sp. CNm7]|uniref:Uncharacterized protein n=1 Tax=Frankia nepalensis TaxID=1836974 RepID=A0A937RBW9_9ACTN|nr:DUF6158 family protein [Frankia nepalensis]MBL7498450.1 hypothetical protein [Frankia nepalensis]MBL7509473.1 hypothetical protein [Frankia nepalensis]MBL7520732.1 hypothetical protein [Frankia nepalensis]MBL7629283.1 hypothetical protein [Frankia nepalensis]
MTTTHRPTGVPAHQLSDDDVRRELDRLHATRHDTVLHGSQDALETHTRRMLELEAEYLTRFPGESAPNPARTRAGARRAADAG